MLVEAAVRLKDHAGHVLYQAVKSMEHVKPDLDQWAALSCAYYFNAHPAT